MSIHHFQSETMHYFLLSGWRFHTREQKVVSGGSCQTYNSKPQSRVPGRMATPASPALQAERSASSVSLHCSFSLSLLLSLSLSLLLSLSLTLSIAISLSLCVLLSLSRSLYCSLSHTHTHTRPARSSRRSPASQALQRSSLLSLLL